MAKPTVEQVKGQIDSHEAICAERWGETLFRLKRLEAGAFLAMSAAMSLLIAILFVVLDS